MNYESIANKSPYIEIESTESFVFETKNAVKELFPSILLVFFFLISNLIPLSIYLQYIAAAEAKGLQLEKGCHGPGVFFGFMSGILFLLLFRFIYLPIKYPNE